MPPRSRRTRALLALLAAVALVLTTQSLNQTATASPPPSWVLRPGTNQIEVLDATPGDQVRLLGPGDHVRTGTVDSQGSLVWRQLTPGPYAVQTADQSFTSTLQRVTGLHAAPKPQSFYSGQSLHEGFNFITTRDGTTLSANVVFPKPPLYNAGAPYPTVVEYSGYDPSNPADTTMAKLFTSLGYAYVGVNIRGTGCSGGSFLPFEPVQSLDGYDAIETIAAQPWAKFHKAAMVGISYPGIEQLYVARTRPPHLSAITPLSVIDDSYRGTLWPGGILNTGFAEPWASQRASDAQPFGEGWEHGHEQPGVRRQPARPQAEPRPGGADRGQPRSTTRPTTSRSTRAGSSTGSTCRSTSPAPGRTSRPAATSRRSCASSAARRSSTRRWPTAPTRSR